MLMHNKNRHPTRNRRFLLSTLEPCCAKAQYGPTNFSLFFQLFFSEQNSLEPARILDFLAPDSICKYYKSAN